ncbi:hypothetical protein G4B88_002147 [Cannabis sativa]|uniref:Uncharacterized protein n=1 Tax=Cannabis sativa TaxID=3483 RepID=A0A7J6DXG0_CANSA|nr:hypothetical protein G4B88_002147 [Cannabis sativa]
MPASELLLSDSTSTNRMIKENLEVEPLYAKPDRARCVQNGKTKKPALVYRRSADLYRNCPLEQQELNLQPSSSFIAVANYISIKLSGFSSSTSSNQQDISLPMSVPGWLLARQLDLDSLGLSHINL